MKLQIITKTKARQERVVKITDSVYEVSVTTMPVEGKANQSVIIALANHFHLHKNQVEIISGFTSINKVVKIDVQNLLHL